MLKVLENYAFVGNEFHLARENRKTNQELLCVKKGVVWSESLMTVKREDVTAWEIFKSHFGYGKLAGCDLRLKTISSFIEREVYLDGLDKNSNVYKTVHGIASRMLLYRKSSGMPTLWEKLATEAKKFDIQTYVRHLNFKGDYDSVKSRHNKFLLLTPLTKVGHLAAQASLQLNHKELFAGCSVGGFGNFYTPWYKPIAHDVTLDDENLKKLQFRLKVGEQHDPVYPMFWDPYQHRPLFI